MKTIWHVYFERRHQPLREGVVVEAWFKSRKAAESYAKRVLHADGFDELVETAFDHSTLISSVIPDGPCAKVRLHSTMKGEAE